MDLKQSHPSAPPVEAAPAPCGSRQKIILRRDARAGCWTAQHIGTFALEVIQCFGTDTVATAFTVKAKAEEVAAYIRSYNPGVVVEVA